MKTKPIDQMMFSLNLHDYQELQLKDWLALEPKLHKFFEEHKNLTEVNEAQELEGLLKKQLEMLDAFKAENPDHDKAYDDFEQASKRFFADLKKIREYLQANPDERNGFEINPDMSFKAE